MQNASSNRIYWGKQTENLPPLDLVGLQRESYDKFLKKDVAEIIEEVSPVNDFTGKNFILSFGEHYLGAPNQTEEEAIEKGLTLDSPLRIKAVLVNKKTGEQTNQNVFLGDIPIMTERGTFIINGVERVVVSQLVRSPGVFFTGEIDNLTGKTLYTAEIRPLHGSWLEFTISRNDIITVRIDRRRKFSATTFLRAVGIGSDKEILKTFTEAEADKEHRYTLSTLEKDPTKTTEEALLEIYRKMRPGEPAIIQNAKVFLENMFFNPRRYNLGRVGRYKMNKKLNLSISNEPANHILLKEDIIKIISYLLGLTHGLGEVDDIDHLANRRLRSVGELVGTIAFRTGILRLERAIKEKMSLLPLDEKALPSQLINAQPIITSVNEFFRSSQLSVILDQTNPLSEIDNLRRVTVMGVGGVSRERASFSVRDINVSQYGRICPVRTPEGPNVGLVTYLSLYVRVNEYGFLETPYRRLVRDKNGIKITEEIVYLPADDEQEHYITYASLNADAKSYITDSRVPVRYRGRFFEAPITKIEYADLVSRQVVGISASLIPFLAHDEANRALMGTHMQCQAVPLIKPAAPMVGTGMEEVVTAAMGRTVLAKRAGSIVYVDATKIVVFPEEKEKKTKQNSLDVYKIEKFRRTSQSTCFSQNPKVTVGDKIKIGDILADGPASDDGELAIGQNLLIAYMSLDGLGYEDAIIISDRLVKEDTLTSVHIEEYRSEVVDTRFGPEEITRDIPNVGEEDLAYLDASGIVTVGTFVKPNDILVGKIAAKGETELTAEERLLRAIFGEKAREVRDTSLRIPHGEKGTVIGIAILDREKNDELPPGTNKLIKIKVAQIRKVVVGDKLAGRHGNKGVISKILPASDMPYLADGTPVDIIISPISILARMNLGQLLEAHLGWIAFKTNSRVAVPVFEKIGEEKINEELQKAGLPVSGKTILYNGQTGERLNQPVTVGIAYIMKLSHMVEDKTHARSTGPYSLVTQQPLGGKAQMGGQRLGEMEVWALEAHRAAHVLQEMLTIKSDDVTGRAKAFEAIVKGIDIPLSTVPESFKVLFKELNSLCLDILPTGEVISVLPEETTEANVLIGKEAKELAREAGEVIVASEQEINDISSPMEIERPVENE